MSAENAHLTSVPNSAASAEWRAGYADGCRDMLERYGTQIAEPESHKLIAGLFFLAACVVAVLIFTDPFNPTPKVG